MNDLTITSTPRTDASICGVSCGMSGMDTGAMGTGAMDTGAMETTGTWHGMESMHAPMTCREGEFVRYSA